jgi:hypothetical protein
MTNRRELIIGTLATSVAATAGVIKASAQDVMMFGQGSKAFTWHDLHNAIGKFTDEQKKGTCQAGILAQGKVDLLHVYGIDYAAGGPYIRVS